MEKVGQCLLLKESMSPFQGKINTNQTWQPFPLDVFKLLVIDVLITC